MPMVLIWIITAVLFVIILTLLGLQPKILNRHMGKIICITGIAGILIYGYGYFYLYGASVATVFKTLLSAIGIFLGKGEIAELGEVPFLASEPMQVVLYLIHIIALYATASAVIAGIGGRLVSILKLWTVHHKDLILIYGVNADSLKFGERIQQKKGTLLIFAGDVSGKEVSSKIIQMGGILFNDERTLTPEKSFADKIGLRPGKQKLSVFCLDENTTDNLRYAEKLMDLLKEKGISPSQTRISLLVLDGKSGELLQADSGKDGKQRYGYGSVFAIEREELAARLLIRHYPPCRTMKFTEKARAAENFEMLVIGFGKTGQAVFRALLMNGQFAGSDFHATIIADQYSNSSGSFFYKYPGIRDHYQIDIKEINSRGIAFYQYLEGIAGKLNYVAICTGDAQENNEIAAEITEFLRARGSNARIVQCTRNGPENYSGKERLLEKEELFVPEILCMDELDHMAKILNHKYHLNENNSIEEDWAACDYFSRKSCRASADFIDAFLTMAGTDRETIREKGWPEDPELMENLSRTEHQRWNAFHFANGYQSMSPEYLEERGKAYKEEVKAKGSSSIRLAKDTEKKLHACLVPWEELDELSEREAVYTGARKDYKQMDLDNIQMIQKILKDQ